MAGPSVGSVDGVGTVLPRTCGTPRTEASGGSEVLCVSVPYPSLSNLKVKGRLHCLHCLHLQQISELAMSIAVTIVLSRNFPGQGDTFISQTQDHRLTAAGPHAFFDLKADLAIARLHALEFAGECRRRGWQAPPKATTIGHELFMELAIPPLVGVPRFIQQ